ncbi:MAG TPA: rhodanese-like domain-containing protein [Flavobacteriaceae bacterium]|nr:rhodanese-like domain-containing protein [Flavobacteriaceae bacterium]
MFKFINKMFNVSDEKDALTDFIKKDAQLIDVRSEGEFAIGHAKESTNIPMQQVPNHLDDLDKNRPIIVFCRTGSRSKMTKEFLLTHGFDEVLNGGSWQQMDKLVKSVKQ